MPIDDTHDPTLQSWVESANAPDTDFPVQNLPLVCFSFAGSHDEPPRAGIMIGDEVLDLLAAAEEGVLDDELQLDGPDSFIDLSAAMNAGNEYSEELRRWASKTLRAGSTRLAKDRGKRGRVMRRASEIVALPPCVIPNYTDFYASVHHATRVGSMFRPDNPLLPNYKHVPIGYHGRASSIMASGSDVVRPRGQTKPDDAATPRFGPSRMLDFELEVGCYVGIGNEMGEPIGLDEADDFMFGLCLVNDWSARDIQKWEYQPLGPFLAKNFATTVSAPVVTLAALEPFRIAPPTRPAGDPEPLEYLRGREDRDRGAFDIRLEVLLSTEAMRDKGIAPARIARGSFAGMYWTLAQMLAHHTSNGCNMIPGDLFASGTVSGEGEDERGCMLELTWAGHAPDGKPLPRRPVQLPTGETRLFLEDGDEVTLRGWCEREGFRRIGFGECTGLIAGE